jgi:imidazole glycerol-phosphate synthase subunit HisF
MHRIITSIYTSESNSVLPARHQVDDYAAALQKAIEYQESGADEVIFMDVTPFNERRRNLPRFLKDAHTKLQIPYVFGGGIHTVADVEEMLKAGAPRIYVNSAAVKNPELINKISKKYGAGSLLVAIDTKKTFGKWKVYLNGGKSRTEIDLLNWIKMSEVRGAGELLISTVARGVGDHEESFDVLKEITKNTNLPVLASIGVSSMDDIWKIFKIPGIQGIVTGHFFRNNEHSIAEVKNMLSNTLP